MTYLTLSSLNKINYEKMARCGYTEEALKKKSAWIIKLNKGRVVIPRI